MIKAIRANLANFITLSNLLFGSLAITQLFQKDWGWAAAFMMLSLLADLLDGAVARALKADSPLGLQLDSLADVVSFGLVPSFTVYCLLLEGNATGNWWIYLAFLLGLGAAWRLAVFNIDTTQRYDFVGLPTPAMGMFFTGILLMYRADKWQLSEVLSSPYFLLPLVVLFSFLMISKIPFFSLKFKKLQWQGNELRLIYIFVSINIFILAKGASFSIIIMTYILLSIFLFFNNKKKST